MTLLIDADDTLWENIVVFHRVNADYISWIAPAEDPAQIAIELDQIQVSLVGAYGYGRHTFERSLLAGVERFGGRVPSSADREHVTQLVAPLRWDTLDVIDDVSETLHALGERRDLIMVTKGDHDEQSHKVSQSGLAHHFTAIEILDHKTTENYRRIVDTHDLDPGATWMIGNSPRSDILPALDAGLGAVHIPHAETWGHEQDDLGDHPRLLRLPNFGALVEHF